MVASQQRLSTEFSRQEAQSCGFILNLAIIASHRPGWNGNFGLQLRRRIEMNERSTADKAKDLTSKINNAQDGTNQN
jgi:hypothetical protein